MMIDHHHVTRTYVSLTRIHIQYPMMSIVSIQWAADGLPMLSLLMISITVDHWYGFFVTFFRLLLVLSLSKRIWLAIRWIHQILNVWNDAQISSIHHFVVALTLHRTRIFIISYWIEWHFYFSIIIIFLFSFCAFHFMIWYSIYPNTCTHGAKATYAVCHLSVWWAIHHRFVITCSFIYSNHQKFIRPYDWSYKNNEY